ncbi:MAG: cyclodeaminase/cyclohydrolase family protein, partial [Anaerolineae bacterium]|nr:cyclodeaminase/cyclohydrolase family protein [Anaerolineae bacterium]
FQYEQLKEVIATDPRRMPDYGPAELGPAGASVIGARPPLVAFNVYLNTPNVNIADRIARAVRHSSGGLHYVKAAGFLVEGQAQVSMNLTNYQKTPVARIVELIRREAARYGVAITFSELVGLAPQEFFVEAARWYLQLDMFQPDQILEYRIQRAESESPLAAEEPPVPEDASRPVATIPAEPATPAAFVNAVADGTPAPGGGAVAALAGSLSAALTEMVARLTIGKKRYVEVEEAMNAIVAAAGDLRHRLIAAIDEDIRAFNAVMDAYRLPKDRVERPAAIQASLIGAADVPLNVARIALDVMLLVEQVVKQGNINAATDAAVAGLMGLAAIEGAALNVRVNVAGLDDDDLAARYVNDIMAIVDQARKLRTIIVATAENRAGIAEQK